METPSTPTSLTKSLPDLPGYPIHPSSEDIYNKEKETDLDPEDITKTKKPLKKAGLRKHNEFAHDLTGEDLDIPGSELDDDDEIIGGEDEENNYYSIGGDSHSDLDEVH